MMTPPVARSYSRPSAESPDRVLLDEAAHVATWGAIIAGGFVLIMAQLERTDGLGVTMLMIGWFGLIGAGAALWLWITGLMWAETKRFVPAPGRYAWLLAGTAAGWATGAGLGALTGLPRAPVVFALPLALIAGAAAGLARGRAWLNAYDADEMVGRGRVAPPGMDRLALACFGEAIRLDPACAAAYRERAGLLGRLRWHYPRSGWAFGGQAAREDFAAAGVADLDAAIALDPGVAADHALRASLRHDLGPYGVPEEEREAIRMAALADMDEAVRLAPDVAEYRCARGRLRPSGDDGALADFLEAVRLDPRSGIYRDGLADCLLARDEPDAAIAEFSAVLALDPRDACALFGRAKAYRAKGDAAAAAADESRAMRLTRF